MSVTIREAKREDAKTLTRAEQVWATSPGYLVSRPDELLVDNFEKKIEDLKSKPNGKYVVAEISGKIVGHALLDPMMLQSIRHVTRLTIVVHKGNENRRLGGKLMDYLISWAAENSEIDKIELNVRVSNSRAIRLYESKGFEREGLLKNRIKTPDRQYIDEVLMGLMVAQGAQ